MRIIFLVFAALLVGCGSAQVPAVTTVTGPTGPKGDPGATGTQGSSGLPGMTISSYTTCTAFDSGAGYNLDYEYINYSTGDAWVSCSVSGTSIQSFNQTMYKSTMQGASNHSCITVFDMDASSGGYWHFSSDTGAKVIYKDVSSGSNNHTYTFAAGECTTY